MYCICYSRTHTQVQYYWTYLSRWQSAQREISIQGKSCVLLEGRVPRPGRSSQASMSTTAPAMAHAGFCCCTQVTTTLLEAVLPALHLSTFLLGELRGQAAAAHISGALCLPAACLEAAERAAACAGVQAERLRLLAVRVGVQYRALFAWLLRVLQQVRRDLGLTGRIWTVELPVPYKIWT